MKLFKVRYIYIIICFILIITLVCLINLRSLNLYDISITENSVKTDNIKLPYFKDSNHNSKYLFKAKFNYYFFKNTKINIIPDDCVEYIILNNKHVFFNKEKISGNNCDYVKGFHIDIKKYLKKGVNKIDIKIKNNYYKYGLVINQSKYDSVRLIFIILLVIIFCILLYFLLSLLKLNRYQIFIFIGAVFLFIIYLSCTNYDTRGHDTQGHIDYIELIIKNKHLPSIDECWQCYHPPVYYLLASIVYSSADIFSSANRFLYLQIFSLITFIIFLIFSIKILNLFIKKHESRLLFSALLLFWPSMVLHSIRIGNDIIFYMFFSISLYYLILWHKYKHRIYSVNYYLIISGIFAGLSLLSKTNGIIIYAIIGICAIYKLIFLIIKKKIQNKKHLINIIIFSSVLAIILSVFFIAAFSKQITVFMQKDETANALVSNTSNLNSGLKVENKIKNYIYFDIKKYLSYPYISTWEDKTGRQFFINILLKTCLYGEFSYDNPQSKFFAALLGIFQLIFIIFFITGILLIFISKKEKIDTYIPIILLGTLSIIALIGIRYQIPYACSNDFRYIYPSIISFIILTYKGFDFLKSKSKKLFNKYIKQNEINFIFNSMIILFIIFSINHTLFQFIDWFFKN